SSVICLVVLFTLAASITCRQDKRYFGSIWNRIPKRPTQAGCSATIASCWRAGGFHVFMRPQNGRRQACRLLITSIASGGVGILTRLRADTPVNSRLAPFARIKQPPHFHSAARFLVTKHLAQDVYD